MQIEQRSAGDVVILVLRGNLTLGDGDEQLQRAVNSVVNEGRRQIVLNLADVSSIDSAGLGEIVRTYTTVSRRGGHVQLSNVRKEIRDLFSVMKLANLFEIEEPGGADEAGVTAPVQPRNPLDTLNVALPIPPTGSDSEG
jgi:anti-sigma B factor antagonist